MKRMLDMLYYGFLTGDRLRDMKFSSVLSLCRLFALCARFVNSVLICIVMYTVPLPALPMGKKIPSFICNLPLDFIGNSVADPG